MKYLLTILLLTTYGLSATFNVSTTPELRTALETAATNGEDDTIILADGIYQINDSLNLSGSDSNLTISGNENNSSLVILDAQEGLSILEYVFKINNPSYNIKIKNLTIQNATNASAVWIYNNDLEPVEITNVTFQNNSSRAINHFGSSAKKLIVNNSKFINNSSSYYGGAITSDNLHVKNSIFSNNSSSLGGGAISCHTDFSDDCIINKSIFTGNSCGSKYDWYAKDISNAGHVINSIFDGNSIVSLQPSILSNNSDDTLISNNLFINNNLDIYIKTLNHYLVNNVLNKIDSTYFGANLYNNIFRDSEPIGSGSWVYVNNIYNSGISFDNNYTTTAYDLVMNKGFDPLTLSEFKNNELLIDTFTTDYNGSNRIIGTIDIGQLEYTISTVPEIKNFVYQGTNKIYNTITFDFDTVAFSGRTIEHIYFNAGDGNFFEIYDSSYSVVFHTAADYNVEVKVIDNQGEESIRSYNIAITDFSTEEAFKYVKDNPSEFDLVTVADKDIAVSDANTSGIATGKQMVIDSPSAYELVNNSELNTSVSDAIATGVTEGKQYVQDNPSEFNLMSISNEGTDYANFDWKVDSLNLTSLTSGWTLLGTPIEITDLSVFDSANLIWIYDKDSTTPWSAYSSNQTTQSAIEDTNIPLINSIPANSGIWVNK